jgi:YVTN family beta-propeller protein
MKRTAVTVLALATASLALAQGAPRLLVLNKEDATFVILNPASGQILGKVPVGLGPHELVVSSDGKYAFASNYGTGQAPGSTISMIDIAAQKEVRRIDVSPLRRPHGLFFANGKLYFSAEADKKIARYDPVANRIDWQYETGQNVTHMVMLTRDGKTILTSNIGSGTVSVIEAGVGGAFAQTIVPVGKGPEGIDIAPDGKTAWSAHSQDGGVSVVDLATKKVVHTFDIGTKRSNRIKLTPDGRFALVSDLDAGDLVVVETMTGKAVKRVPLGKSPEGVLIPPTGGVAYVAVTGDNRVAVIDLENWTVLRTLETGGTGPDGMAWVP